MRKQARSSLGGLLESFLTQRLVQQMNASPATLASYKDGLRLLLVFAAKRLGRNVDSLRIQELDYELVLAFLDSLESERGNSVRTRNARLAVIRSFFRHVAHSDPERVALANRMLGIPPKLCIKCVVD
jgi:integrase/recombinase XerD